MKKTKTGNETKAAKPIKTMTQLRDDLLGVYEGIGTGEVDLAVAKEKSNAAGKIIKSASVQLEYAVARNEKPRIPFMR